MPSGPAFVGLPTNGAQEFPGLKRQNSGIHFNAQRPTPNAQRPGSESEREALLALEVGSWELDVEPAGALLLARRFSSSA